MEPIYDNPNNHKHNKSTYVFLNLLTALLPFSKPEMIYLSVKMTELFGQCKCVHTSCIVVYKNYIQQLFILYLRRKQWPIFQKRAQSNQDCFGGPGSVWTTSTIDNTWANICFTCTLVWYIETSFELFLNHQLFHQSNVNFISYVMYK